MINRTLADRLQRAAAQFPVVTVTGPRQSGKTTLVKHVFQDHDYLSLELPDVRDFAREDPRGFLAQSAGPVILDEIQRTPELLSYIQVLVDEHPDWTGRFVLTGSHNFLLHQSVSQSLAGRSALLHLLPFSLAELTGRPPMELDSLGKALPGKLLQPRTDLMETLWTGFYPRIHDKHIPPRDWLAAYYQTYVERDVRSIVNVGDLETFGRFVRLCAGRSGQLLNLSALASDCGVSHVTAKRWLSVLQASFIVTLLRPHHKNFGKRLIKSPKLYFLDTGLLCYLLNVRAPEELLYRAERGAVFETFVVAELTKNFLNRGEQPSIFFWRDVSGREIDVILENGQDVIPLEIKSGQTLAPDFFRNLQSWKKLAQSHDGPAALIYGGDQASKRSGVVVYPWFTL